MSEKNELSRKDLKNIKYLGLLANVSTVAGLMGTIYGLILVFVSISSNSSNIILYSLLFISIPIIGLYFLTKLKLLQNIATNFKKRYSNLSIVGIMLKRRTMNNYISILLIIGSVFIYILSNNIFEYQVEPLLLLFFVMLIIFSFLHNYFFKYRVINGFYGTNEQECREILNFIISEYDKIDFLDNGKRKKIISENDLQEIEKFKETITGHDLGTAFQ